MPALRQSLVSSVIRRYPLYSGCGTLANHRRVQRLAGPGDDLAWARVHGGNYVAAPLSDYVGRAVFYAGELDRKVTWICSRLVRPGDTVLDIGANLGLVSFILSALVGPNGTVHAFEPIPQMQDLIEQGMQRNNVSNIVLHKVALGDEPGELTLSIPKGHFGSASLVAERRAGESEEIVVPVRRLPEELPPDLGPIRLIKIDVEGFEPQVLAGAAELLRTSPPDAILFELNDAYGDLREHRTIQLLADAGYGFFSIPKCYLRMRLLPYDHERDSTAPGHDFVAARSGSVYAEVARRLRARIATA
jgi:FkbM family methyltransferase